MNDELKRALIEDFPKVYLGTRIDVGNGWEPLLRRLGSRLATLIPDLPDRPYDGPLMPGYLVDATRKSSGLHLWLRGLHPPEALIDELHVAEVEARETCDACGAPGEFRKAGKVVRCDAHAPAPSGLDAIYARRDVSPRGPLEQAMRPQTIGDVVGQDAAIEAMLTLIDSDMPRHVILYGPPGVGKTTAARAIHAALVQSPRSLLKADAPFVEIDGSAVVFDRRNNINSLLGSFLPAFYGAASYRAKDTGLPDFFPGAVTQAHGGVLFVDEIGEMQIDLLNRLLKVMEDGFVSAEALGATPRALSTDDDDDEETTEAERTSSNMGRRQTSS